MVLAFRPDIVLQGHQPAMFTDAGFFDHIAAWNQDYAELHRRIMPLGEEETHFNLNSWGGWIWPYRTHQREVEPITVQVTVQNPFPHPTALDIRLVGPSGWQGETATLEADARAEISTMLTIVPSGPCRRQPFAVELTAEEQCFGQIAEALATLGHERF